VQAEIGDGPVSIEKRSPQRSRCKVDPRPIFDLQRREVAVLAPGRCHITSTRSLGVAAVANLVPVDGTHARRHRAGSGHG